MQKNARAKNATIKMPAMIMIVLKVSSSIGYGSSAAREKCPAQGSKGARLVVAIA